MLIKIMSSSSEKESFDKQLNPNSCSNPYDNADFRSKETTIATTQLSESSPQPLEFEFRDS